LDGVRGDIWSICQKIEGVNVALIVPYINPKNFRLFKIVRRKLCGRKEVPLAAGFAHV